MNTNGMMESISILTTLLPILRDKLHITQLELANCIGISRQSLIEIEHKNRKLARPVLISLISYFSMREVTAQIMYENGLYDVIFVIELGFTRVKMEKLYDWR